MVAINRPDSKNAVDLGPSKLIIKRPVICAISGYAVAGGLELLADMRGGRRRSLRCLLSTLECASD